MVEPVCRGVEKVGSGGGGGTCVVQRRWRCQHPCLSPNSIRRSAHLELGVWLGGHLRHLRGCILSRLASRMGQLCARTGGDCHGSAL